MKKTDTLIDVGVDYLTATFVGKNSESKLAAFGRYLVTEERARGEKWREFRFSGYKGETCGSASFGIRQDGHVLRISSAVAKAHWNQAYALATNITRIDVQVTVKPDVGPTRRLLEHHKQLRRRKKTVGRPSRFKVWYGPSGPEALALGKRSSDVFGRVYDKGIESRLPEYLGTLRYEAELKRMLALRMAASLDWSEDPAIEITHYLSKLARIRGLRTALFGESRSGSTGDESLPEVCQGGAFESGQMLESALEPSELLLGSGVMRRSASWLNNSVKPTIQKLVAMGHTDVVLESLGLSVEGSQLSSTERELWNDFNKWR